ncbi:MAG: H(+)-transporting ATPase [Verrucomicrobia bacterium]|nr:MAG: H(+)-transporting ATPase [Verrucomicrobiota bacterium]PYK72661.1 MAG: H(+)-transporting ATPase [Verrucomicrobiota bacterium]
MISDVCRRKHHAPSPPRSKTSTMQVKKEVRQLAREMLRASFTDGQLDRGRIASVVDSILAKKSRNYLKILEYYKRLLRLEAEKRHARIETTTALEPQIASQISLNLARRYGTDLTTEFVVNPALLGGMRIRVGSDVWDSSVRNRLERLQQQL